MRRQRILEILDMGVLEWPDFDHAGVVDQDVNDVAGTKHTLDDTVDLVFDAQVGGNRLDEGAAFAQLLGRLFEGLCGTCDEPESRAFVRQLPRDGEPQAARPPGNDDGSPAK